ncbi:MAG: hypothetical protein JWN79_2652 [Gemmatimonadetes bacterium]|nr:hypothetical protein [Gemmatimonadota bacterium]
MRAGHREIGGVWGGDPGPAPSISCEGRLSYHLDESRSDARSSHEGVADHLEGHLSYDGSAGCVSSPPLLTFQPRSPRPSRPYDGIRH